jgi:predicted CoA-binding protein
MATAMDPRNLENARAFLSRPRFAFVGLSRDAKDFSRMVFRELVKRGIDVVPVNPGATELEGRRCFRRVAEIEPKVEAVLVMTHPAQTDGVLADCVEAGVTQVWLHRGAGKGSGDARSLAYCAAHGITVVRDLCPFMALPAPGFPHQLHGFFRRHLA